MECKYCRYWNEILHLCEDDELEYENVCRYNPIHEKD